MATLDQQESLGDFEPGEMERSVADGERGGPSLDGEAVFAEIRALGKRGLDAQR